MHDSHIHLAMEPLKSNILDVVETFIQDGGKHILTQGTDIVDFDDNFDLAKYTNKIFPNTVQVAIGIHPSYFEEITLALGERDNIFEKSQKQIQKFDLKHAQRLIQDKQ